MLTDKLLYVSSVTQHFQFPIFDCQFSITLRVHFLHLHSLSMRTPSPGVKLLDLFFLDLLCNGCRNVWPLVPVIYSSGDLRFLPEMSITLQVKRMKKFLLRLNFLRQIPTETRERWNRKLEEYARASSYAIHR